MWLFTKVGFFSVVLKEKTGERDEFAGAEAPENVTLMVRARFRDDLDSLRLTYAPKLSATVEWPGRDYPYRAFISKQDFAEATVKAVLDLDYGNFKSKVAAVQGYDRSHLYGGVWGVMNDAEAKLGGRDSTTRTGRATQKKKLL